MAARALRQPGFNINLAPLPFALEEKKKVYIRRLEFQKPACFLSCVQKAVKSLQKNLMAGCKQRAAKRLALFPGRMQSPLEEGDRIMGRQTNDAGDEEDVKKQSRKYI